MSNFFGSFQVASPLHAEAVQAVMQWCHDTDYARPGGLVLWSRKFGVGKTHLASAAHAALREIYRRGAFLSAPEFLDRIKQTYNDKGGVSENQLFVNLLGMDYIILDDVGKEYADKRTWADEKYFRLIDGVVRNGHSLLLTSNLDLEQLAQHVGGAAWSRVAGLCGRHGFVNMNNLNDYRLRVTP